MMRFSRLAGIVSVATVAGLVALSVHPVSARPANPGPGAIAVTVDSIALQLGVQVSPQVQEMEFEPGVQFTGTLVKPEKLAAFGIKGMNAGARVTAARIALDRVFVEADELNPPARVSTRLRLGPDGRLSVPPRT